MRFLIASSATGGHIYPALAVADTIRRRDADADILFVGASDEIGRDIVGDAGYEKVLIDASGLDRRNPVRAARSVQNFFRSGAQVKELLAGFAPAAVLGMGGYVIGPVAREAYRMGLRVCLQEQNVLPGLANKFSERYADRIFLGFEEARAYFHDPEKLVVTGNPVREAFADAAARAEEIRERLGVGEGERAVLIFGGSQGADAVNAAGLDVAERFAARGDVRIFFITGQRMYGVIEEALVLRYGAVPESVSLLPYADAIYEYYAAADLIVARSGALTVSEIAATGRASILIPSPNVTNDHQYYNAKVLSDLGAARILRDPDTRGGALAAEIETLLADPAALEKMAAAAHTLARPDAADRIVDELFGSGPA